MRDAQAPAMTDLFDLELRRTRRDRAARMTGDRFLLDRAFEDCLERIGLIERRFQRALLIGCPAAAWIDKLAALAGTVEAIEPGPLFARAAGARLADEHQIGAAGTECYDLVLAVGTLDTANALPLALRAIRLAMADDGLFLGAMAGGDTLPRLRDAMRSADLLSGEAAPHVHPRIDAASLGPLLASAGFTAPVIDVDRVPVSYRSLESLVADLRAMAATNILAERPRRALTRAQHAEAGAVFMRSGDGERVTEMFEILHFAAWTPGLKEHA